MNLIAFKILAFINIIFLGIIARSRKLVDGNTSQNLSKIVFSFTLPAAIIHAFGTTTVTLDAMYLVLLGFLCTVIPFAISAYFTQNTPVSDRKLYLLNISGFNIGCFALPFIQALFPPFAAVLTCLFDAGNALMVTGGSYTATQMLLAQTEDRPCTLNPFKRLISSIAFDTYLVLILVALLNITIPNELIAITEPLSQANAFLSLFMIGLMINFHVDKQKLEKLCRLVGGRILLSTVMSLFVFFCLPLSLEHRLVVSTLVWSPIASLGPVYTLWIKADYGLAGLANSITIVLGICALAFFSSLQMTML
ncbi:AEC family transporter [Collinsella sp. zg1085]|uniref:AEC family transporter n=1 Tax=Collinsella sp. zg1085 TaxID=2844380 RepID=UPI001C0CD22C|nr:AEC family transporter [Collinsella sp. zg1085]QWT17937.1 AEC family transporter [Collinsella sp. zg1085]